MRLTRGALRRAAETLAPESSVKSYWPILLLAALATYVYLQMSGRLGGR